MWLRFPLATFPHVLFASHSCLSTSPSQPDRVVYMPSQLPPPETQADDENVRRFRWGIFEVAYELPPSTPLFSKLFPSAVQDSRESFRPAFRLFRELYSIAPKAYTTYNLGCLWLSIAPALSLYLSYSVLSLVSISDLIYNRY